jgi:hypothetical protein
MQVGDRLRTGLAAHARAASGERVGPVRAAGGRVRRGSGATGHQPDDRGERSEPGEQRHEARGSSRVAARGRRGGPAGPIPKIARRRGNPHLHRLHERPSPLQIFAPEPVIRHHLNPKTHPRTNTRSAGDQRNTAGPLHASQGFFSRRKLHGRATKRPRSVLTRAEVGLATIRVACYGPGSTGLVGKPSEDPPATGIRRNRQLRLFLVS